MQGWILIVGGCIALLITGLAFGIGAAVGASTTYSEFEALYLPLLSTAGSWVSGIGALGAVAVSLWLADRQRREDVAHIVVRPRSSIVSGVDEWLMSLEIVSDGRRPSTVTAVAISAVDAAEKLQIINWLHASRKLPAQLQYGDTLSLITQPGAMRQLAEYAWEHCNADPNGLRVIVSTTLRDYVVPMEGNLVDLIRRS